MPRATLSLRSLSLLALALSLQACSTLDPHEQAMRASRDRADAVARSGYQPSEQVLSDSVLQQWPVKGHKTAVALMLPNYGGALPVVVYLPGLGESAEAGILWRQAWAKAGYAVLSVQPLDEDVQAWSSPLARDFEFKALARERHAPAALRERLDRLAAVLDEARRRAREGDPLCARMDFSRMAVAGYDLGAQAAMALGGEHAVGDAPDALSAQFRGAVVLSPVVLPDQKQRERYDVMARPVLSISGPRDVDPTGLLSTELRGEPFALMPAGDKFELMLRDADHAALSGRPEVERASRSQSRGAGGRRGRRGAGGSNPDPANDPSLDDGEDAPRNGRRNARWTPEPMVRSTAEDVAVITSVSVAFLDASLRERAQARRWLDEQVPGWLHGLGTWRTR
ncbi:MAG TPA: hypothetical protein VN680_01840 [Burkholderiaceae bacterium]|nr:hypothetical protein [Burkholderiaceae bacterium]